jgi:hypothetical protein
MSYGGLIYANPNLVNYDNSQWSAGFTSKQIPPCGLPEPLSNVAAASASKIMGGTRHKKSHFTKSNNRKRNNSIKIYKGMGKHRIRSAIDSNILTKKRLRKNKKAKKQTRRRHTKRRMFRGGWSQYQNNVPLAYTYGLGGLQNSGFPSALANPPIYSVSNNCVDNYNHYTNMGFPSKGSY